MGDMVDFPKLRLGLGQKSPNEVGIVAPEDLGLVVCVAGAADALSRNVGELLGLELFEGVHSAEESLPICQGALGNATRLVVAGLQAEPVRTITLDVPGICGMKRDGEFVLHVPKIGPWVRIQKN